MATTKKNDDQGGDEREVIDSIDGVDYRVEWHEGVMFIEPGHDKVTAAYEAFGRMLYFTERCVYQLEPKVGSHGTPLLSEASGSAQSAAQKTDSPSITPASPAPSSDQKG